MQKEVRAQGKGGVLAAKGGGTHKATAASQPTRGTKEKTQPCLICLHFISLGLPASHLSGRANGKRQRLTRPSPRAQPRPARRRTERQCVRGRRGTVFRGKDSHCGFREERALAMEQEGLPFLCGTGEEKAVV